jgi:2-polyprenyl-3-methyl-5-hydroxy-6-metoxy-1,4-benzoquinol methylase
METPASRPKTIDKLRFATDSFLAVLAGMQLDVFTPLKTGPKTAEEIGQSIGVGPDRLRLLLYCLVTANLLAEQDGRFSNTPEADQFLVKGSPSYMGNQHVNYAARMANNLKTAESIRTGVAQAKVDFSNSSPAELETFLRRINLITVRLAHILIETYGFASTQRLADVGCGGAGLAITLTKAYPKMHATAIDLAQITPIAQKFIDEQGASDRVKVMAADVLSGPLSGAYDTVVLRALLQVLSAQDARLAVKNIAAAISPGGTMYIVGQILDDCRTSPLEAVGFNLGFINLFDAGESYTEQDHRDWLTEAGFVDIERANFLLPDGDGIMIARKPKREK